jgi:hypothetical protein
MVAQSQLSLAAQSYKQQLRELGEPVEAANSKEQGHLVLKFKRPNVAMTSKIENGSIKIQQ